MKMIGKQSRPKSEIKFNPDYEIDVGITNIPITNGLLLCEKDQKEIHDGDIVEFRYNESADNGMIWEPLKLRDDKIKPQFF